MDVQNTSTQTATQSGRFRQTENAPTRKVVSATLASALATIFVWAFNTYVSPQMPIPQPIAGAITTVFTFLTAYFVPPARQDAIEEA